VASPRIVRATIVSLVVATVSAIALTAQQRSGATRNLTNADYARAERFMSWNTTPLVFRNAVSPNWMAGDRFWYRVTTSTGNEAVLVDPATGTKAPCTLPACAATASSATGGRGRGRGGRGAAAAITSTSPDGKRAVFIRDGNLVLRDNATGQETPLTTDGVKDFGYATDNAGWIKSDRPVLVWSPDSRKIVTFQQDDRPLGEMYLVTTKVGHPELSAWKYPLPGDSVIAAENAGGCQTRNE